jgi:hypothetical protein
MFLLLLLLGPSFFPDVLNSSILLLAAITGSIFQFFDMAGQEDGVQWLMAVYKGHFGPLNLAFIYPYLNTLGLIILVLQAFQCGFKSDRAPLFKQIGANLNLAFEPVPATIESPQPHPL